LQKEIKNSKQYFEKEGWPESINQLLANIEDGLNKGAQGKKLSTDNQSALKSLRNKFKKYVLQENIVDDLLKVKENVKTVSEASEPTEERKEQTNQREESSVDDSSSSDDDSSSGNS